MLELFGFTTVPLVCFEVSDMGILEVWRFHMLVFYGVLVN